MGSVDSEHLGAQAKQPKAPKAGPKQPEAGPKAETYEMKAVLGLQAGADGIEVLVEWRAHVGAIR